MPRVIHRTPVVNQPKNRLGFSPYMTPLTHPVHMRHSTSPARLRVHPESELETFELDATRAESALIRHKAEVDFTIGHFFFQISTGRIESPVVLSRLDSKGMDLKYTEHYNKMHFVRTVDSWLNQLHIILIDEAVSRGISIQFNGELNCRSPETSNQPIQCMGSLSRLEVAVGALSTNEIHRLASPLPLLDPVCVSVEMEYVQGDSTQQFSSPRVTSTSQTSKSCCKTVVTLGRVESRISFQDVELIQRVLCSIQSVVGSRPVSPSISVDTPRVADSNHTLDQPASVLDTLLIATRVRTDGICLTVVDDLTLTSKPLLEVRAISLTLSCDLFRQSLEAVLALKVSVYYHNFDLVAWEPMLEPWGCTAKFSSNENSPSNLLIDSNQVLNLNVTSALIRLVASTAKSLAIRSQFNGNVNGNLNTKANFSPFWIRNETGDSLQYRAPYSRNVKELKSKQEEALQMRAEKRNRRLSTDTAVLNRTISLLIQGIPPIENIAIDKVGTSLYRTYHRNPSENPGFESCILCDVSVQDGVKMVTIRSRISMVNQTSYPLQIRLLATKADGYQITVFNEVLQPAQRLFVPLRAAKFDSLQFRPVGMKTVTWNSPAVRADKLAAHESSPLIVSCGQRHVSESIAELFYTSLLMTREQVVHGQLAHARCICFQPPFLFENLCASTVEYRLSDQVNSHSIEGRLNRGEETGWYAADLCHTLLLSVKLPGYAWSQPAIVHVGTKRYEPVEPEMESPSVASYIVLHELIDSTKSVCIDICSTMDRRSQSQSTAYPLKISVHCQYWLINNTESVLNLKCEEDQITGQITLDCSLQAKRRKQIQMESRPRKLWLSDTTQQSKGLKAILEFTDLFNDELIQATSPVDGGGQTTSFGQSGSMLYERAVMFSLRNHKLFATAACIQVDDSKWATPFDLDTAGTTGVIEVTSNERHGPLYMFGVEIDFAPDVYFRTKLVTFAPRFVLVNRLQRTVQVKQVRSHARDEIILTPNQKRVFHWPDQSQPQLLCFRLEEYGWDWSGEFPIQDIGEFAIRLCNSHSRQEQLTRVELKLEKATVFVIFREQQTHPYRIENLSLEKLRVHQKGQKKKSDLLLPYESRSYAWMEPTAAKALVVELASSNRILGTFNLDKINEHTPIQLPVHDDHPAHALYVSVFAEGPTKILRIRDWKTDPNLSAEKRVKRDEKRSLVTTQLSLKMNLQGIGISIINNLPMELVYISLSKISATFSMTESEKQLNLLCGELEIDNQLPSTPFPVLLHANKDQPFLQLTVTSLRPGEEVDLFRDFSVLLQAMDLNIDGALVWLLYAFITDAVKAVSSAVSKIGPSAVESTNLLTDEPTLRKIYFELFHIGPIRLNVSFASMPGFLELDAAPLSGPLRMMLNVLGVAFANVENAPLRLNELYLEHPFSTQQVLVDQVVRHYAMQIMAQAYRLMGSADLLGNPINLVAHLGTGMKDFFYEPALGLITSPTHFGFGVFKGTSSLVRHTLYAGFNASTKISGAITKSLAALSMDDRERQLARMGYNIGFFQSFLSGITGLVVSPIRGLEKEGVRGLGKGLVHGVVGVVAKPVVGVLNVLTLTSRALRDTVEMKGRLRRVRPPRFLEQDGLVTPFSFEKSLGHELLARVERGRWRIEGLKCHIAFEQTALLWTNHHLILMEVGSLTVMWSIRLADLLAVDLNATETRLRLFHMSPAPVGKRGALNRLALRAPLLRMSVIETKDKNQTILSELAESLEQVINSSPSDSALNRSVTILT
eukprot:GILJ01013009.1.p1 GENE.GILJ01013009.1~~GILJ01013009.1.p1  ORF type:complete len:1942 (-),score=279.50 GILJ01013009.1:31-5289(-)